MPIWPFRSHDPTPFMPIQDADKKKDDSPKYVDEARFTEALNEVKGLTSKLDQFTGLFTGLISQSPGQGQPTVGQVVQQAQDTPIPDITDDDYADALLRGDAAKIATRTAAIAERKVREVRKEYDQRFRTLETQGMTILEQVSGEVGQQSLGSMPYYQLFKQDIDAALKQLPVHQRTPEMRIHIYHATLGANLDKVRAHDVTESVRMQRERDQPTAPGRMREQDQGPTPESVFGADVVQSGATARGGARLWERRTPDEWARARYGVKDMQEAAVYATNVHAIENCRRCFGPIIGGKCHCQGRSA